MQMYPCRKSWIKNELGGQVLGDMKDWEEIFLFKTVKTMPKAIFGNKRMCKQ